MRQQGYITDEQKQAENEKVNFSKITTGIKAPHFVLWVQVIWLISSAKNFRRRG